MKSNIAKLNRYSNNSSSCYSSNGASSCSSTVIIVIVVVIVTDMHLSSTNVQVGVVFHTVLSFRAKLWMSHVK